ncbi:MULTISPECIES: hypothetical protein [unclassified Pseudomonas]|jgi:hypothetical protein|uniref:hypothetical protein n=1 Tax=unclassified Pseudomonas TaxID=196821 RepID=UPI000C153904|nr:MULTISPECIES: hypothetical protein [unclassified Pseudomonas]NMX57763.1 hypothetical protein [Pseudomonas sp. WS 5146]PIB70301.1 hypothetical protein AOA62_02340 [Pseudomonas sp. 2995-3]
MAQGYINDRLTDYISLKNQLMGHAPGRQRADPYSVICSLEEAWLVRHAEAIGRELDARAATQLVNNYDLLQSLLGYGSLGMGSSTSAWARHLDEVAQTLEEIERLHQRLKTAGLEREAFLRQRQALFGLLDTQLQGAARFGTGLRGNQALKKILGVSTKSYLHKGEIAGYAQRMRSIAQTSKWLGMGTYVGLALDVGVAGLEIKEACVEGREAQCRRAKYVETGKLVGGVGGAYGGGKAGAKIARLGCKVFLGVVAKGNGDLACAVIGGAAGGFAVGNVVGDFGAFLGGQIEEIDGDLIFQPEGA